MQQLMPNQKGLFALPATHQFHSGLKLCVGVDERRVLAVRDEEQCFQ